MRVKHLLRPAAGVYIVVWLLAASARTPPSSSYLPGMRAQHMKQGGHMMKRGHMNQDGHMINKGHMNQEGHMNQ